MSGDRFGRLGDRVQRIDTGAAATIVHSYGRGYVDISYDAPQPTAYADGTPTTTTGSCISLDLLAPIGQASLFIAQSTGQEAPSE